MFESCFLVHVTLLFLIAFLFPFQHNVPDSIKNYRCVNKELNNIYQMKDKINTIDV
ncbi:hypothetical protein HMPREF9412_0118 [Paenibacillus sp. HGF5]|nr:hypothetical protein HMPREF9412_0118 [Paenibacillus sp. HGF5]